MHHFEKAFLHVSVNGWKHDDAFFDRFCVEDRPNLVQKYACILKQKLLCKQVKKKNTIFIDRSLIEWSVYYCLQWLSFITCYL